MNGITDFLYARPSFIEGFARILDFGGTLQKYNGSESPEEADRLALALDVQALSQDMQTAIQIFVEENLGALEKRSTH